MNAPWSSHVKSTLVLSNSSEVIFIHNSKYDSFCYFNSLLVNLHAPNSCIVQQTPCHGRWAGSLQFFSNFLENSWILKRKGFFNAAQISDILVGTSNGTDRFSLVWLEYSGPALKVVLFDRSGLFSQLDWNNPFLLRKLLSPIPLFCFLLTRTITEHAEK